TFPVVAVRFPIVVGENDYTKRLHFHVEKVLKQEPISLLNADARMSFITDDEAAQFLYWAGLAPIEGPYNATAKGSISLKEMVALIEREVGKQAKLAIVGATKDSLSPFAIPADYYMSTEKAEIAGFEFSDLHEWLPNLIRNLAKELM
ncbi:MAG: NAD-dependent dehydratase, partial [Lysinibacillus sp.]